MARPKLDRDKVRVLIERLDTNALRALAHAAADLLPAAQVAAWLGRHVRPGELAPDRHTTGAVLATVEAFHAATLRGDHYEGFSVNSKNYREQSRGTREWIAECERLFSRCGAAADAGRHREARTAFDLLLDLLRRLDEGEDDLVFFADEGGSWRVGVPWRETLPRYFTCVAASSEPDEFAAVVRQVIDAHASGDRTRLLAAAKQVASREQRAALERRPSRSRR